jgi:rsbT co-antagonist protein RsbR
MSIRTKLIATLTLMIALIATLGAFVLSQLAAMHGHTLQLSAGPLTAVNKASLIKDHIIAYQARQLTLASAQSSDERSQVVAELADAEAAMQHLLDQYRTFARTRAELRALEVLGRAWQEYVGLTGSGIFARQEEELWSSLAHGASYHTLLSASSQLTQAGQRAARLAVEETTAAYDTTRGVTISLLAIVIMFGAVVGFSQVLNLSDALNELRETTRAVAGGNLAAPISVDSDDELGALAGDFRTLMQSLQAEQKSVQQQQRSLVERNHELEQTYHELQVAAREREALHSAVRALTTPVLPVHKDVLVAPLIGVVDSERASQFRMSVLEAAEMRMARTVIIDVTGLAMIDRDVAQLILQTGTALRLLGARTMIAGIKPEVAQTLVGLGESLNGVHFSQDLQHAVSDALGHN